MGRRSPVLRLGTALAVLLVASHTLGSEECKSGCRGAAQTFKYAVGTTYKYDYDGKIEISLSSAEGQVTSTEVKAQVLLTQLGDCNQILKLQNVQILGAGGKKYGQIPDISKPVRLNFHDGHLEDSICVEPGDNQNSINVKRAIASIFQANLKGTHETDVFGLCPTSVSHHKDGNVLVIHKSRNLNKCAYRENINQDFLSTNFNLNSELKASPLLSSDYNAKLKIKNGILDEATITEDYLYVPFSVGKKGAKAQVVSKLTLTGTGKDSPSVSVSQRRSIIFEDPHPVVAPTSNAQTVLNAVKETANTIDATVNEKTAKEFVSLIRVVRASKKADLLSVYSQVKSGAGLKNKAAAKRIYLDALLRAGNADTVEVVIELLKSKELDQVEEKLVYLGLSFVRHASESSLNAATALLDQPNLPREAYLGIGNLAGRFCRQHACDNVGAVNKLTQKFISKLGDNKADNRKEENDIIYIIKALANFHHLNDAILQKLVAVAQDKKAPNRLRVAALEAFLADPCKDKLRDSALNILKDVQQDSEVRIKAYLVVAQCPNAKIGNAVKALLEKEPSLQVGGFIASHIRNLKASANVDKSLAKQHLSLNIPKNKFPVDPRKYSFNGEFSYSVDSLGLAAATETNVIYSQNSWLPRSSSLNLTAEIFGHNFNFLEIQTRQENLDKLVEHYFGPKGIVRNLDPENFLVKHYDVPQKWADLVKHKVTEELKRSRRDVSKAEIDHIAKQVQIKTNELNKDLDLDISLRAFGSEVLFLNFNEDIPKVTPEALIDRLVSELGKGLDRLKNFDETVRSNLLFLDAEIDYPTSLGFPLRLAAEGISNIQIQTKGAIDVRKIVNGAPDGKLKLHLIPSANIEISGRLTLDALVVENGLKVSSTLYTAVGGDVTVEWSDHGKGLDIKFGVPEHDQRIISATHDIVFHVRDQAGAEQNEPLKFTQVKDFSVCVDQLSKFVGLAFCFDVSGPNLGGQDVPVLPFPLSGYGNLEVKLQNEDVSEFHIKRVLSYQDEISAQLIVEALGKNKQRKSAVEVEGQLYPQKYFKASLISPVKRASVEARLTSTNNEKSVLVRLNHDNAEYLGRVGVAVSGSESKSIYKPFMEYKTPDGPQSLPFVLEGQVIVERNGQNVKYKFENLEIKNQKEGVKLIGSLEQKHNGLDCDLRLTDGVRDFTVKGLVVASSNLFKFNVETTNTISPEFNFNAKGELKRQAEQYDVSFQLIHGADLSSKTNIFTISNSIVRKINSYQDFTYGIKSKVTYPLLGLDSKFEFEQTQKSLDYDLDVKYNDIKFGSELDAKINQKTSGDYEIEFELYGLDNNFELKARRHVQGDESKISNSAQFNDKKVEVNGKIKHQIKPHHLDVGADLDIVVPTHKHPVKVNFGLKLNNNELDIHDKLIVGGETLIDGFLKANRDRDVNGNIKVNIKNYLVVQGQIKATKGSGNGDILIDSQSGKHQIKAESNFQIQPPSVVNVEFTLYPVFNKDKNEKIVFKTANKLSDTSVDTKNHVNFLGHNLEANVKGNKQDGKINGEFEVTFPGDQYIQGKLNTQNKETGHYMTGQSQGVLEYRKNKNTPGRKVSYSSVWKNTNFNEGVYDVEHKLSADDSNGQNINADLVFKQSKEGDSHNVERHYRVHGSLLKTPLEVHVKGHCKKTAGDYLFTGKYGSANVVNVYGKYDVPEQSGKPISGELKIDLASTSKVLKVVNVALTGSALKPKEPSNYAELAGSVSVFADDDGTIEGAYVELKAEGEVKANDKNGDIKGNLAFGSQSNKVTVNLDVNHKETDKKQETTGSAAVVYGKDKTLKLEGSLQRTSDHHYKLTGELQTPFEGHKVTKLAVESKRADGLNRVTSSVRLDCDGKIWSVDSDLTLSESAPVVDLKLKCPEGKLSEIYFRGNRVSDKEFSGELKLLNEAKQFTLEGGLDVDAENIENFHIKGHVNSPNLNLNKITLEAQNKPGKTDRKIQVLIKSAGKNLISGSTSYAAREEHGKYIVDGSGSFKVKDETKSGNFKFIVQKLTQEKNGEQGLEVSFDAGLGEKAIDAEFKATNKQFRILNSYCEKKKECAHVEIDNKISSLDVKGFNQVLEVNIDLRKLGLSHEFGLKSVTNRKEYVVVDHTVDIHLNSASNKYQYSFYFHPEQAGISLTTPKRIVAVEAKVDLPKDSHKGGKSSGEIVLYLDKKNHPNKKTSLSGFVNINVQEHTKTVNGEVKLVHPGLQKPLAVTYRGTVEGNSVAGKVHSQTEFDLFAHANQKVIVSYVEEFNFKTDQVFSKESIEIKSSGLGVNIVAVEQLQGDNREPSRQFNYETSLKYEVGKSKFDNVLKLSASPSKAHLIVKVLNTVLLEANSKIQISQDQLVVDTEARSYDNQPLESHLEIKDYNTFKYSSGYKNQPNKKLQINAGFIPDQIADIRADFLNGNTKSNLFHATLKLDEANFLKPDYSVDSKAIEHLLQKSREHSTEYAKKFEQVGKEWTEELRKETRNINQLAGKSAPNLQPIKQYYTKELKEFEQEILNDKSLKDLGEVLSETLAKAVKVATEVIEKFAGFLEEVSKVLQHSFSGVLETIEHDILPQLKTIGDKVFRTAVDIFETASEITFSLVAKVVKIIEQYQPEFQALAETLRELNSELASAFKGIYANLRTSVTEYSKRIVEEIKAHPVLKSIKDYFMGMMIGFPSAKKIAESVREFITTLKEVIPHEVFVRDEILQILDVFDKYFEKQAKGEPVDEIEVLQHLGESFARLLKKLLTVLAAEQQYSVGGANLDWGIITFEHLRNIPRLAAIRFSPLSFVLHEDLSQELANFFLSLVNTPRQLVPPFPLYGLVIQGQHIFTFDGKHITFPGKCNYLLARDAYNGNFTIGGTYKDGLLVAITVADKHNQITLHKDGQVKLDNAAADLPVRKPDLAAFRNYETISIVSTAGVTIECTPDLLGCAISVSGFYHGQLRGLLGNGNNEPYDDFTIPSGKIVTTESEFGNAYKLTSSCPAVTAPGHEHKENAANAACSKLFSWESPMAFCYPFVPTQNFKLACAHGLEANVKNTQEAIAKAYVAACHHHGIPISVPEELVKCTNADKEYSVGDQFSVKLPSKSADIVLLIDTVKKNEQIYKELITPLVQELGKELHSKGVNDVEFHLVAYGGENQWPSHVTVNGKLTFKGKAPTIKFSPKPEEHDGDVPYLKQFKGLLHAAKLALGLNLQAETYNEGINYPFRANALKSVVALVSEPCEVGAFYPVQKLRTLLYKNNQISLNLFTPFEGLTAKDAKKTKDIVGFNSANVFTLSQGKKNPKGSPELLKVLDYDDYCSDFTVRNRGNVFVNDNFLSSKPADKKQFVHIAAHNIVDQLINIEQGLDCECRMVNQWHAQNVCHEAYTKERSSKKV